jgi:hypothetical protein
MREVTFAFVVVLLFGIFYALMPPAKPPRDETKRPPQLVLSMFPVVLVDETGCALFSNLDEQRQTIAEIVSDATIFDYGNVATALMPAEGMDGGESDRLLLALAPHPPLFGVQQAFGKAGLDVEVDSLTDRTVIVRLVRWKDD